MDAETTEHTDRIRVFISYCRDEIDLAKRVDRALFDEGFQPVWDQTIQAGDFFTDVIKDGIAHAHVFLPIITAKSVKRLWLNQETGYAVAHGIPILPLCIGEKRPSAMLSPVNALIAKEEWGELEEKISSITECIKRMASKKISATRPMMSIADSPKLRTSLIVEYATWVKDEKGLSKVRQRGAFSSLSIPDRLTKGQIWRCFDGSDTKKRMKDKYHALLRQERKILEEHVRKCGCRLIVNPKIDLDKKYGDGVNQFRLSVLKDFLSSTEGNGIEIVMSDQATGGNFTAVGNWFSVETHVASYGGYRQSVFQWHAPTVLAQINDFDKEFDEIVIENELDPDPKNLREAALKEIDKLIGQSRPCNGHGHGEGCDSPGACRHLRSTLQASSSS